VAVPADVTASEGPDSTPKDSQSAQGTARPITDVSVGPDCYCESRDCRCTPENIAAVNRLIDPEPLVDRTSYAYRFGGLAMDARLFLLGLISRAEFVRSVNAAHDPEFFPPLPEEDEKPVHDASTCRTCIAIKAREREQDEASE